MSDSEKQQRNAERLRRAGRGFRFFVRIDFEGWREVGPLQWYVVRSHARYALRNGCELDDGVIAARVVR